MRAIAVCCVILTVTITATCLEKGRRRVLDRSTKRVIKRDASLLVDTSPIDTDSSYKGHSVIAFKRFSRARHTPIPKQVPRAQKPKKYKKPKASKPNGYPGYKKKAARPKYYRKLPVPKNNNYSMPPRYVKPYTQYQAEPAGFAEPPTEFTYSQNEYEVRPHPQPYNEDVRDSYGRPIKPAIVESYPPDDLAQMNSNTHNLRQHGQNNWRNYDFPSPDTDFAYSNKRPSYEKQEYESLDEPTLNNYYYNGENKPHYNMEQNKYVRLPWKVKRPDEEDDIVVGGQYAEPPPRYVPKFQPSAPMYESEDDFVPAQRILDADVAASSQNSPYVNYKYSNMAFSPQNLNDAFSIVA